MGFSTGSQLQKLLETLPQKGKVVWIGIRPVKQGVLKPLLEVDALENKGLEGDHYSLGKGSKRQVTLIMQEHLLTIASILEIVQLDPGLLRRNIVVSGINLFSLKDKKFKLGDSILEYTGECHPCSRMETNLGNGGYNAVRGHGGITAKILQGGKIKLNDQLAYIL